MISISPKLQHLNVESIVVLQLTLTLCTKYSTNTVSNQSENAVNSNEIRILINIGEHFIDENNIRSVSRFGKGTKITMTNGLEIVVDAAYDKVVAVVSKSSK